MSRPALPKMLLYAAIGAAAAELLDPSIGRRRRALLRDQLRHFRRIAPRRARGMVRSTTGPLQGALHAMERHAPGYQAAAPPDLDQFITSKVETRLGRLTELPLDGVNFEAVDGIVRIRGTAPDSRTAIRIVMEAAEVDGVRAVKSLMHTPDGVPVGGEAGDLELLHGQPRAAVHGEAVRRRLMEQWPALTDADILASNGHIETLVTLICTRTGEAAGQVRPAVEQTLLAAV